MLASLFLQAICLLSAIKLTKCFKCHSWNCLIARSTSFDLIFLIISLDWSSDPSSFWIWHFGPKRHRLQSHSVLSLHFLFYGKRKISAFKSLWRILEECKVITAFKTSISNGFSSANLVNYFTFLYSVGAVTSVSLSPKNSIRIEVGFKIPNT